MTMTKVERQGFAETITELVWAMDNARPEDTIKFEGRPLDKYDFAQAVRRLVDKHLSHD